MRKFIKRVWGRVGDCAPLGIVLMLSSCASLACCLSAGDWFLPACGLLCWLPSMGAALWMLFGGGGE